MKVYSKALQARKGSALAIQPKKVLLTGLGIFWILDAFLQLQPGMFTMDMISDIMKPNVAGEPWWIQQPINWSIKLVSPHLIAFNWSIVAVQFAIGILILQPAKVLRTIGLWSSITWGLLVWFFGEALGNIFNGSATFYSGAPGSVILYVLGAVLLMLPDRFWTCPKLNPAFATVFTILAIGFVLQFNPTFWTPQGVAEPFEQASFLGGPTFLQMPIDGLVTSIKANPLIAEVWLTASFPIMLVAAYMTTRSNRLALAVLLLWLAMVWYFGQGIGMLFSGMATDPNSAPLLALLVISSYRAGVLQKQLGNQT